MRSTTLVILRRSLKLSDIEGYDDPNTSLYHSKLFNTEEGLMSTFVDNLLSEKIGGHSPSRPWAQTGAKTSDWFNFGKTDIPSSDGLCRAQRGNMEIARQQADFNAVRTK